MSDLCARCDAPRPDGADWAQHTSGLTSTFYLVCPACEEKKGGMSIRSGDVSATDDQLKLFIERIERLEEEKRGLADDIRDTYAEAKAVGYDAKIMREVVKLRRLHPNDRAERDALLDTYRAALGLG
jgi:uncharacterized protein (UPF0335 family)